MISVVQFILCLNVYSGIGSSIPEELTAVSTLRGVKFSVDKRTPSSSPSPQFMTDFMEQRNLQVNTDLTFYSLNKP